MKITDKWYKIDKASKAAIRVLLENSYGRFQGLPKSAAWGYPEPYTRDIMWSVLGVAVSENDQLISVFKNALEILAKNQSARGHIPSLIHDPNNRGASDTTPLFLLATGIFRKLTNQSVFLEEAVQKAMTWMEYQSPCDEYLIAQQPTSDWRDEQWTTGYGLYVNTLTYSYLDMLGYHIKAENLKEAMQHFIINKESNPEHIHEGLVIKNSPYYAFWSYKIYSNRRFDLLGNCLAVLSGLASPYRSLRIMNWIERECSKMQKNGELAIALAPNFFPYIVPGDTDWRSRYYNYNQPGEYHNGGIWPFVSAIQIAALIACGKQQLAEKKLHLLTDLITIPKHTTLKYGFNEWYKAQNGMPMGHDWQTWSAALYLYAVKCVKDKQPPFFHR